MDKVLVLIRIVENLEECNNRNSERKGYSLPGEDISHGLLICEIGCSNNSLGEQMENSECLPKSVGAESKGSGISQPCLEAKLSTY